MKKLKIKKQYGIWYYRVIKPTPCSYLEFPIYTLYDSNFNVVSDFGSYGDMKYYVETGERLD